MTTRALEDSEIKAIFDCVDGCNAERNRTMLIIGIGMALRASELVGLTVGDIGGFCISPRKGALSRLCGQNSLLSDLDSVGITPTPGCYLSQKVDFLKLSVICVSLNVSQFDSQIVLEILRH